jgi:hypothetical protein
VEIFRAVELPSIVRIMRSATLFRVQGGQHDSNGLCGWIGGSGLGGGVRDIAGCADRAAAGGGSERRLKARHAGVVRLALPSLAPLVPLASLLAAARVDNGPEFGAARPQAVWRQISC